MKEEIHQFIKYLKEVKNASENTRVSYERDLLKLVEFLETRQVVEIKRVTQITLNSYLFFLEKEGKAPPTISRALASIKSFFRYLYKQRMIDIDPAEDIKSPKVEKKSPVALNVDQIQALLNAPNAKTPKEMRDKAMFELLYATGIRVSELIHLKQSDINLSIGYMTCQSEKSQRTIPFGKTTKQALVEYLTHARPHLQKEELEVLFINCSGKAMTRQGFWKIIRSYTHAAGLECDITPQMIRHSFAIHLVQGGADTKIVQAMLGLPK